MADITYNVRVNLETKGNLTANIGSLNSSISGLGSVASGIGHSIGGVVDGLRGAFEGVVESIGHVVEGIAKMGAVAAFGAITYGATKLNSELEKTQIGLAAIFTANGITGNIEQGMEAGGRIMTKMRKDAAELPGEFKDLVNIFQMAASSGLHAGLSPKQLESMSAQVMAASAATGISMPVAAREFSLLLSGRATATNLLGQKVFGLVGDRAKEFRGMSSDERVKFMTEGLQKFAPAIEAFKGSFEGLWTTLVDNVKMFVGSMTGGLFQRLKSTLGEINKWFDENRNNVDYWAHFIGDKLVAAFDWGKQKIIEWGPPLLYFANEVYFKLRDVWVKLAPYAESFANSLKSALGDGSIFGKLETVLKLYIASKGVGAVQGLMPSSSSMMSMAMMSGGGGGGALAGAAGALAPALGITLVGLIPAFVAMAGAVDNITNANSRFHDAAMKSVSVIQDNLGTAFERLGRVFDEVGPGLHDFVDTLGNAFLTSVESATKDIKIVAGRIEDIMDRANAAYEYIFGPKPKLNPEAFESPDRAPADIGNLHPFVGEIKDALTKTPPAGAGGGHVVHVDKVEINISSNADPTRIARMTAAHLSELKRHTKISPFSKNFSQTNI